MSELYRGPATSGRTHGAAGLAALALLAGCAVGPDFAPPEAKEHNGYTTEKVDLTPADGSEAKQELATGEKIPRDWWALFRSPQLNQLLQQAIEGNRTVAAARATLTEAEELVTQVEGQRYPQVNFAASATRQRTNLAASDLNQPGSTFNVFSLGPTVSFALDIFGGLRRQAEKQEAVADFQNYQLSAAYLTLTGNVVTQAVQIGSIQAQIKAVEEIIAHDERTIASVDKLFRAHEATRIDVQSAASQLATDRTQLPPLRQQLSQTRHALAVLVGQAPADWRPPNFELDDFVLPEKLPLSLPSELVHQRPDILAAEAQLHASSAAIGVATAQLYPSINLSGGISQSAISTAALFTSAANIWSIGANLAAPIFNGWSLIAQKRAAEADFHATLLNYEQTVLQSFEQVADTLEALTHDSELAEAERRAVDSTKTSVELAHTAYAAGEARLIEVLDAERQYQQARLGYVKAAAQRLQDTAQLFVAMGGGWREWSEAESAKMNEKDIEAAAGKAPVSPGDAATASGPAAALSPTY
jgi:NodT family efflux transporter outer membrane factor (OMF) lipoprotein